MCSAAPASGCPPGVPPCMRRRSAASAGARAPVCRGGAGAGAQNAAETCSTAARTGRLHRRAAPAARSAPRIAPARVRAALAAAVAPSGLRLLPSVRRLALQLPLWFAMPAQQCQAVSLRKMDGFVDSDHEHLQTGRTRWLAAGARAAPQGDGGRREAAAAGCRREAGWPGGRRLPQVPALPPAGFCHSWHTVAGPSTAPGERREHGAGTRRLQRQDAARATRPGVVRNGTGVGGARSTRRLVQGSLVTAGARAQRL